MRVIPSKIPEVLIVELQVFGDHRGCFFETFQSTRYAEQGLPAHFVQDNFSRSRAGVLRGLHYQLEYTQGKLIGVTRGEVYDVAVDIRYGSPTFGQWVGVVLSAEKPQQLYIPPGFAHGFCVLSEEVDFYYKCTDIYYPAAEKGIRWNDPDLAIDWPIDNPILSAKDLNYPALKEADKAVLPRYSKY